MLSLKKGHQNLKQRSVLSARVRNSAISRRFVRKVGVPAENPRGDNHDHIENEEIKIAPIRTKKYLSSSSLGIYHLQLLDQLFHFALTRSNMQSIVLRYVYYTYIYNTW